MVAIQRNTEPTTGLGLFLQQVAQAEPLPPEEERELARRHRETGDPDAARRLIFSNLRYVVKVAFEYRHYGCDLMELIQQGCLGLAEAVARFDPDRGTRLVTYASWWIRDAIRLSIMRARSVSAKGTTRAERKLCGATTNPKAPQWDVCLEDVSPGQLACTATPESALLAAEEREQAVRAVRAALARLDEREQEIATKRFMADDPETLSKLGERFGVSRERARQIAERAKRKLQATLEDALEADREPTFACRK